MRNSALAVLLCAALASQLAAQKNAATQVIVTNATSRPVPTTLQGTATVTGNVNVTNSSLPVSGSVSITNTSVPVSVTNATLPVSGTITAGNLPLDANGNVRTSVAP